MLAVQLAQLESAQLVRALWQEEATYLFTHTLSQETAYESLLVKRRGAIHRRVAEAYEQFYGERLDEYAALLAYHYAQAGDDVKTVEYSLHAAQAAVRLYAYPEAREHLRRALDSLKRLPDTQENRRRRVDAIFVYFEVGWGAFDPDEMFGLVSEAEALANSLENPDGTRGDPRRLAQIHTRLTGLHLARGEYREAIRYARQGYAEATGLDDGLLLATFAAQLGISLMAQGYLNDAQPYLVRAVTLSEETTDRWEWYGALGALGTALAMCGQVEEGLAEVQRALARVEASQHGFGIAQTRLLLLSACLEQEDARQLLVESERAMEAATRSDMALHASLALGLMALAQSRLGQTRDALETMAASQTLGAQVGSQHMMTDWLAAVNAEIAYNAGKQEDAMRLAEQAVALARVCDGIFAEGWAQRVWGQAGARAADGRYNDEVDGHLARSLELFERGGAVIEVARTHVAWGRVLQARGEAEDAREHFEKAAAQFRVSGLTVERERTRQLSDALSA